MQVEVQKYPQQQLRIADAVAVSLDVVVALHPFSSDCNYETFAMRKSS